MAKKVTVYIAPCGHPIRMNEGHRGTSTLANPEHLRCFKCRREKGEGGTAESDRLVRAERAFIAGGA